MMESFANDFIEGYKENEKLRIKKWSCFVLVLVLSFCILTSPVSATGQTTYFSITGNQEHSIQLKTFDTYKPFEVQSLKNIGSISVKQTLVIDGIENDLYCTFDDAEQALSDLQNRIPTLLNILMDKYTADSINAANWKEYKQMLTDYQQELIDADSAEVLDELQNEFLILSSFCEIFRSYEQNEEIIENAMGTKTNTAKFDISIDESAQKDDLLELALLLPYTTPLAKENNTLALRAANNTRAVIAGFDQYKGYLYALDWATRRSPNYPSFSGDCANFTSQILQAGGVNQVLYSETTKGWWCTWSYNIIGQKVFKNSLSWSVASTFANYMGTSAKTSNFYTFSGKVIPGDFVGFDETGKGSVSHMGFVTTTGTYNTYNGKYYKDFMVAQHTTDYHAWASSSTNNWETLDGQAIYCIVRRSA